MYVPPASGQKVHASCTMFVQLSVRVSLSLSLSLSLFGAPPQKISKHAHQKNQKAVAYGTGAGGGSYLNDQEAPGAGKAFAYSTGAGGRSNLVKLRDGARHCNSALSLSVLLRILSGAAKAPWRPSGQKVHASCTMFVQLSVRVSLSLSLFGAPPQKISKHAPKKNQKACAYGTEAGSGSHLANQEAPGAGKAFAYGTGAGGCSHLAKLRDGARHCAELYAAL